MCVATSARAIEAPFCLDWFFSSPDDVLVDEETEDDLEDVPLVDEDMKESANDPCLLIEWSPSEWVVNVFSSRTGQWRRETFFGKAIRQG